jgi:hypothetical protein
MPCPRAEVRTAAYPTGRAQAGRLRAGKRLLFRGGSLGGPKDDLSSAVGGALQHLVGETNLSQGEHFPDFHGEPARFNTLCY